MRVITQHWQGLLAGRLHQHHMAVVLAQGAEAVAVDEIQLVRVGTGIAVVLHRIGAAEVIAVDALVFLAGQIAERESMPGLGAAGCQHQGRLAVRPLVQEQYVKGIAVVAHPGAGHVGGLPRRGAGAVNRLLVFHHDAIVDQAADLVGAGFD